MHWSFGPVVAPTAPAIVTIIGLSTSSGVVDRQSIPTPVTKAELTPDDYIDSTTLNSKKQELEATDHQARKNRRESGTRQKRQDIDVQIRESECSSCTIYHHRGNDCADDLECRKCNTTSQQARHLRTIANEQERMNPYSKPLNVSTTKPLTSERRIGQKPLASGSGGNACNSDAHMIMQDTNHRTRKGEIAHGETRRKETSFKSPRARHGHEASYAGDADTHSIMYEENTHLYAQRLHKLLAPAPRPKRNVCTSKRHHSPNAPVVLPSRPYPSRRNRTTYTNAPREKNTPCASKENNTLYTKPFIPTMPEHTWPHNTKGQLAESSYEAERMIPKTSQKGLSYMKLGLPFENP